jgi:putative zinc finger protein
MSTHPEDQHLGSPSANRAHAESRPECAGAEGVDGLSCLVFVASLDDYLEDELTPTHLEAFETHLATCPDCPNYLDSYQKTIELGRSAVLAGDEFAAVELPPDLILGILSTLGS